MYLLTLTSSIVSLLNLLHKLSCVFRLVCALQMHFYLIVCVVQITSWRGECTSAWPSDEDTDTSWTSGDLSTKTPGLPRSPWTAGLRRTPPDSAGPLHDRMRLSLDFFSFLMSVGLKLLQRVHTYETLRGYDVKWKRRTLIVFLRY